MDAQQTLTQTQRQSDVCDESSGLKDSQSHADAKTSDRGLGARGGLAATHPRLSPPTVAVEDGAQTSSTQKPTATSSQPSPSQRLHDEDEKSDLPAGANKQGERVYDDQDGDGAAKVVNVDKEEASSCDSKVDAATQSTFEARGRSVFAASHMSPDYVVHDDSRAYAPARSFFGVDDADVAAKAYMTSKSSSSPEDAPVVVDSGVSGDSNAQSTVGVDDGSDVAIADVAAKGLSLRPVELSTLRREKEAAVQSIVDEKTSEFEKIIEAQGKSLQAEWMREKKDLSDAIDACFKDNLEARAEAHALRLHFEESSQKVLNQMKELVSIDRRGHSWGQKFNFALLQDALARGEEKMELFESIRDDGQAMKPIAAGKSAIDQFNKDFYFEDDDAHLQQRWINSNEANKERSDFDKLLQGEEISRYKFDNITPFKAPKRKAESSPFPKSSPTSSLTLTKKSK